MPVPPSPAPQCVPPHQARRRSPLLWAVAALIVSIGWLAAPALADDMPIATINVRSLPYDQSPTNYKNAPTNYSNALTNYENAGSNYENSATYYENAASYYDNLNGSHRLTLNGRVVGYFRTAKSGVTNFFSKQGKRVLYTPKQGDGVYDASSGAFAGVLQRQLGRLTLCLDEAVKRRLFDSP